MLENPDGLRLPEGAVVTVGDGGSARIGDTVLRPGDVATIEHGRVEVEHDQPVGAASGDLDRHAARDAPADAAGHRRPRGRTPKPTAQPTAQADAQADARPRSHAQADRDPDRATADAGPDPVADADRRAHAVATAPAPHLTARPRLRAHANPAGNRVLVRWTATRRARSYVLIVTRSRVGPAPDPGVPGLARSSASSRRPRSGGSGSGSLDPVVEVRVMVVALGRHGHEVSRSRIAVVPTGGDWPGVGPRRGPATTAP